MDEIVEIIDKKKDSWGPKVDGHYFTQYEKEHIKKLNPEDQDIFKKDTIEILSQCINPKKYEENIKLKSSGVIIGLIQSGKTSSMEAVTSLAKDNGFKIIIIMSGLVNNLTDQTADRIFKSLRGPGWNSYVIPSNMETDVNIENDASEMVRYLKVWDNPKRNEEEKKTTVILTMKNPSRLEKMRSLIKIIGEKYDLTKAPCLIIDDEGDEASPNTFQEQKKNTKPRKTRRKFNPGYYTVQPGDTFQSICEQFVLEGEELKAFNFELDFNKIKEGQEIIVERPESATHREVKFLRRTFPYHTYLSYTATPQALLLADLINFLSPKFAKVLKPGSDYTGGSFFFNDNDIETYTKIIPQNQLTEFNENGEFPLSLRDALHDFFIGSAYGRYKKEHLDETKNRTMMVTPSHLVAMHGQYMSAIQNEVQDYLTLFDAKKDIDYPDLINQLKESYSRILISNELNDVPSFNDLLDYVNASIEDVKIIPINAQGSPIQPIKWESGSYERILIGGKGLERGYTVEGLTITYMSRPPGTFTSDTLQQRARFFGYRKKYHPFIKIYLPLDLREFYRHYIDTEKNLHDEIERFINDGNEISRWPRVFLLDKKYKITSKNKIAFSLKNYLPYLTKQTGNHTLDETELENNRKLYSQLLNKKSSILKDINIHDWKDRRTSDRLIESYDLKTAYEEILLNIQSNEMDNPKFLAALMSIKFAIQNNENRDFKIILMQPDSKNDFRTVTKNNELKVQIHGGRDKKGTYPGDLCVHYDYIIGNSQDELALTTPTLQVYSFSTIYSRNKDILVENVPYFSLYLPESMAKNLQIFT